MAWSLRVSPRRFDSMNLVVILRLILLFQEDSESSGGGGSPKRRLRPLLAGQAGHVEAEPDELDLAGDVVKVLAGLNGCFVLASFSGRGGRTWSGC